MSRPFDPRPLAELIWREVGYQPAFPRDIERAVMETFDAAIVLVPGLSIASVDRWMRDRGLPTAGPKPDRLLRGCLLARRGTALIFVDGTLDANEKRFAVAHELAHLFVHYLLPRRRAIARFGDGIREVLDGDRVPTVVERLACVLQGVTAGPFEDFLGRGVDGRPSEAVVGIEREADLVALELLAPGARVGRHAAGVDELSDILVARYGLPEAPAREWARFLASRRPRTDTMISGIERAIRKKS